MPLFGEGDAANEKAEMKALRKQRRDSSQSGPPSLPPSPPSPLLLPLPSAPSLPFAPSLPPSPPPARSATRSPSKAFFKPAPPPDAPKITGEQEWAADTISSAFRRKEDLGIASQEARERRAARLLACYIRRYLTVKRRKEARTLAGRIRIFRRRWERPFRQTADSWRSWLLYYHMPYDQTAFGKFHMWQSVLLLLIAAYPGWYVRATFFTIFLGCLMRDMEEFQFVRFILGLKGSGFISGVIAAVKVSMDLWQCTVLKPMTCHLNGPGVGNAVHEQIVIICWLQVRACVDHACVSRPTCTRRAKPAAHGCTHMHAPCTHRDPLLAAGPRVGDLSAAALHLQADGGGPGQAQAAGAQGGDVLDQQRRGEEGGRPGPAQPAPRRRP